MSDASDSERRRAERLEFVTDVEVAGLTKVRSTDLSVGGIYLEALTNFPENTPLDVVFALDRGDAEPIRVRCRVISSHEAIGFGLRFEDLSPENEKRIEGYISAHS